MVGSLDHLEGKKLCVVFLKVADESSGRVQLQCLHGRAGVERGKVTVHTADGISFTIPSTALPNILPSDGTLMLRDAEYFCIVKMDPEIDFISTD